MSKMIQIRHVSDRLHQRLRARAAASGLTLSDYLKVELERLSGQFTYDEVRERLAMLEPARVRETAVKALRAEREGR